MREVLAIFVMCGCVGFYANAYVPVPPEISPKYQVHDKHIHLKYGRLHLPDSENEEDGHLRYRWLADDIVKKEDYFEEDGFYEIEMTEKTIKLPGGCELTEDQYGELESFKKATQYVKKCYCEHGGVYCQLRKKFIDKHET